MSSQHDPVRAESTLSTQRGTALVTGAAGQDGILLSELLVAQGYEVWGLVRGDPSKAALLQQRVPTIKLLHGDMRQRDVVVRALRTWHQTKFTTLRLSARWDALGATPTR